MNEDIIKEIKSTLPWLVAAALAVAGYYGIRNYRAEKRIAASEALTNTYTVEETEEAVAKFGSSDTGAALKLKLAKKYFDEARYEDAAKLYDELAAKEPDGFQGAAAVGKAQCLEGLGRYAEAKAAFEAFAAANGGHFLALTAKIGAIRTTALAGDKAAAEKAAAELKESVKDDPAAKARAEALEDLVKRLAVKK